MTVTVIAGDWVRRYIPVEQMEIILPDGFAVNGLLGWLDIPANEIGIIAVNGKAVRREDTLRDGDRVKLFPVIIGG